MCPCKSKAKTESLFFFNKWSLAIVCYYKDFIRQNTLGSISINSTLGRKKSIQRKLQNNSKGLKTIKQKRKPFSEPKWEEKNNYSEVNIVKVFENILWKPHQRDIDVVHAIFTDLKN